MLETNHNNIWSKYYNIGNGVKDLIGRNFNVEVIHDEKYSTTK